MFDFSIVTNWFHNLLAVTCGLGDFWTILIECILVGVCILAGYAILAIILIFMERKVCAYFQCRLGLLLWFCEIQYSAVSFYCVEHLHIFCRIG